ncbi:MAG: hypothetical protein L0Z07_09435, partial [Planctomycetes bacterium]|nr:hypothetical protein [Planctomycetota bacterium]
MARKDAQNSPHPRSDAGKHGHDGTRPPKLNRLLLAASGLAVIGLCVVIRAVLGISTAEAQIANPFRNPTKPNEATAPPQTAENEPSEQPRSAQQASAALPRPERPKHDVMAVVNGQDIRHDALGTACVERFGEEVLEGLVNKRLIMHHCRNRN